MIPYKVVQMFGIGPLHFNMYGIMFALGFLAAIYFANLEARKRGISKQIIYDMAFYIIIGTIIGARLFYVLFYWPNHMAFNLFDAFKIWQGGMSFFGGLFGGVIASLIYTRKNKLNFLSYADLLTAPLIIGHIFGRFGDYFIGGHPGKLTSLPWAIYLDNALRHPVVLYEIIGLFLILGVTLKLKKIKFFDGFVFSSYITLYSIQRMILDFFRLESTDPRYLGLTPSQFIVIILFIAAISFMIFKFNKIRLANAQAF